MRARVKAIAPSEAGFTTRRKETADHPSQEQSGTERRKSRCVPRKSPRSPPTLGAKGPVLPGSFARMFAFETDAESGE